MFFYNNIIIKYYYIIYYDNNIYNHNTNTYSKNKNFIITRPTQKRITLNSVVSDATEFISPSPIFREGYQKLGVTR